MKSVTSRRLNMALASATVLAVLCLCGDEAVAQPNTGPIQSGAPVVLNDGVPREVRDVKVQQKLGESVSPDYELINSQGEPVTMGDYLNGELPLILTLNYSNCPMLCNVQLNQLAQSLEKAEVKIGEDFRLLSVSIDPTETNERLIETKNRYVEQVPSHELAAEEWSFCRTDKENVDRLAEEVGFSYKYNEATGEYAHPAMLVFVSPNGLITRYSLGVAFPPDQMKLAIVEAGQGSVGSIVDQFVLWCYNYDPAANSYVPQAWKIMRAAGAATIALMFIALIPYWVGRKGNPKDNLNPSLSTTHSVTSQ